MICPYNHMKVEQVTQDRYEYDVEGRTTFHENKLIETRVLGTCMQEDCGSFYDGRCMYNITTLPLEFIDGDLLGCEDEES